MAGQEGARSDDVGRSASLQNWAPIFLRLWRFRDVYDAQRVSSQGRKRQIEATRFAAPVQLTVGRQADEAHPHDLWRGLHSAGKWAERTRSLDPHTCCLDKNRERLLFPFHERRDLLGRPANGVGIASRVYDDLYDLRRTYNAHKFSV